MFSDYKVRLDAFEGPLDLLLFLIRRAEVDIHDIPVATITEQYLAYLEELTAADRVGGGRIDIERAGEFLVMAATLMEIKSRMLAPPGAEEAEAAATSAAQSRADKTPVDPRAELVRQLLEYKRYRDATERLEEYRSEWDRRFPLGAAQQPEKPVLDEAEDEATTEPEDLDLVDLVEAFARIIETVDLNRIGEHHVRMDETPVELHAEDILDRLRRRAEESFAAEIAGTGTADIEFREIFAGRNRSEMIGLFLAMLELVKQRRIAIRQDAVSSSIMLGLAPDESEPAAATSEEPDSHAAESEKVAEGSP